MQTDAPAPEFPRPLKVSSLPPEGKAFKETADGAERAALAERFGARKVKRFAVEGRIAPEGSGWRLTAEVRARITQTCVVTLEPVDQLIEEAFSRLYLPDLPEADETLEVDLDPEEDDEPEPLGRFIDPGEAAAEAAGLALDPYPRAEGIAFARATAAPRNAEEITDEDARPKPFAALAELKAKLEKDED